MVLRVFGQLKKFIDEYFEYCSGAEMSSIAMDEVARKALISLIKGPLRGSLERLTAKDNVGLHQLMQLSINIGCLDSACTELCKYIRKSSLSGDLVSDSRLLSKLGSEAFKDIRSDIEMHIPTRFEAKIDVIIELGRDNFDFSMSDDPTGASNFIRDTINFLSNNLKTLSKLSQRVQETTLFSVCLFLNRSLMDWLTGDIDDPSIITQNALRQLLLDLNYLEHFAAETLPNSNDTNASEAFVQVHQLLDLTINSDWSCYFSTYKKADSPYLRISPHQARVVFQKLPLVQDLNGSSGMMSKIKQTQKNADRKKLNEEIIRQLRRLEGE